MMKFLWLARDRYDKGEWRQLDLDQEWAYPWFPYSWPLVDLVRQCVQSDARARPSPLELFKTTKEHAVRSLGEVQRNIDRDWTRKGGVYEGMVLTRAQQIAFVENPNFNQHFQRETDWFYINHNKMQMLRNTRHCTLAYAPPLGSVALLSGLAGHMPLNQLTKVFEGVEQHLWLEKMLVFNEQGRQILREGGSCFLRYVARDCLKVPELNRNWKVELAQKLRRKQLEALQLDQKRIRDQMLSRIKHVAIQATTRKATEQGAKVANTGHTPRMPQTGLTGGVGNMDFSGRAPQKDNDRDREDLLKPEGGAPGPAAKGLKRASEILGGVKAAKVAKRQSAEKKKPQPMGWFYYRKE